MLIKKMKELFSQEPAMFLGVIQALLSLFISFGLNLKTEQTGAILTFSAVLIAFITRSQVVPVDKLSTRTLNKIELNNTKEN